jgi:hypothetical protein
MYMCTFMYKRYGLIEMVDGQKRRILTNHCILNEGLNAMHLNGKLTLNVYMCSQLFLPCSEQWCVFVTRAKRTYWRAPNRIHIHA